jgi:hypothetical protein
MLSSNSYLKPSLIYIMNIFINNSILFSDCLQLSKPPLKPFNIMCILSYSWKRLSKPLLILRVSSKPLGSLRGRNKTRVRIVASEDRIRSHSKRFLADWEAYSVCKINIGTKGTIFIII